MEEGFEEMGCYQVVLEIWRFGWGQLQGEVSELRRLNGIEGCIEDGDDVGIVGPEPTTKVGGFGRGEEPIRCAGIIKFRRGCW